VILNNLRESETLQASLNEQAKIYQPLAIKGSVLFMQINDLKKINNMYRFSLAFFIALFKKCLQPKDKEFASLQDKLRACESALIAIVFDSFASSLFKHDRLMLALHIVHGIYPSLFLEQEWLFFLGSIASAVG